MACGRLPADALVDDGLVIVRLCCTCLDISADIDYECGLTIIDVSQAGRLAHC